MTSLTEKRALLTLRDAFLDILQGSVSALYSSCALEHMRVLVDNANERLAVLEETDEQMGENTV